MSKLYAVLVLLVLALPAAADDVRAAAEKALPLLLKGAEGHIAQRTCFACHNQTLPVLALTTARSRGFPVRGEDIARQTDFIAGFLKDNREKFVKGQGTGGQADTAGYALLTLELGGHKADGTTEAVVDYLLQRDADKDHWRTTSNRPPSEASDFTVTYLALRGLRVWATPAQKGRAAPRVAAARRWLTRTHAKDTEDLVFRLWALKEAEADKEDLRKATDALEAAQRCDGGWAQNDALGSDAYATGSALVALNEAAGVAADSAPYRRGVAYLVRTQAADGSWRVRSRSKPFQTYYESGFPHGTDQFISIAASGWAAAALWKTLPTEKLN